MEHIRRGVLVEAANWVRVKPGGISLQLEIETKEQEVITLEAGSGIFADNGVLAWLELQKINYRLEIQGAAPDTL
ncbi:hypothetical protein SMA90_32590, partial [Escherichia coli]